MKPYPYTKSVVGRWISASLLLILSLSSCFCIKLYFDKGDTFWTDPYKKNMILIFKSNKGNADTIKITNKLIRIADGNCNPLEVSNFSKSYIEVNYKSSHTGWTHDDYLIQITKDAMGVKPIPYIRLFNLEFSDNRDSSIVKTQLYLNSLHKNLKTCFKFQPTKYTDLGPKQNKISTFYWDHDLGLVKYENKEGEYWELISKR